ncbi:MAG: DUF1800 family protein [Desulfovibrionaceae bacterium]|nr:DUF1800 family protein [Desulfovibrionaceae bacterium]MBF0514921.1 DUF1800 family protein [Desulfovibrionaceae bacterium]
MPYILAAIVFLAQLPPLAAPAYAAAPPKADAALAALRLTYGPTLDLYGSLSGDAAAAFVRSQLDPQSPPLPGALTRILASLPLCSSGPVELFRAQSKSGDPGAAEAVVREAGVQALAARLARAAQSPRQLGEVMDAFWLSLFLPDSGKSLARLWYGAFEREAVLPFALGRFEDLLAAALRHPAMLVAYDNWLSSAPGGPGIKSAPGTLNPELARAVLGEMTMGQTQLKDVNALAEILTGWGLGAPREPGDENGVSFDALRHAKGPKIFLGSTILDVGRGELAWAAARLAAHPATAKFVCAKLAAYFLSGQAPPALVEKLAAVYREHDGSIREVLAALFASREFLQSATPWRSLRSDFEYAAAAVRLLGPENFDYSALAQALAKEGCPLFGREPGRPAAAAFGKQALAARERLAEGLCRGDFAAVKTAAPALPASEAMLAALPVKFSEASLRKIRAVPEAARPLAILSSDEFMAK